MALDPRLLEILACPEDKGPLLYFPTEALLYNPRLRKQYRVEADVPQLLLEEAVLLDADAHQRLMQQAQAQRLTLNF